MPNRKILCDCCERYEMDVQTNGAPACQWCIAWCRDQDECQVLANEPRSGYFFGRPDTSNRLDVDPWSCERRAVTR